MSLLIRLVLKISHQVLTRSFLLHVGSICPLVSTAYFTKWVHFILSVANLCRVPIYPCSPVH